MNNFLNKAAEITRSFLDALSVMGELDWSSSEVNYPRVAIIGAASIIMMFIVL